jgi:hypothetical protein
MEFFIVVLFFGAFWAGISYAVANGRGADPAMAALAGFLIGPLGLLVAFLSKPLPPKSDD